MPHARHTAVPCTRMPVSCSVRCGYSCSSCRVNLTLRTRKRPRCRCLRSSVPATRWLAGIKTSEPGDSSMDTHRTFRPARHAGSASPAPSQPCSRARRLRQRWWRGQRGQSHACRSVRGSDHDGRAGIAPSAAPVCHDNLNAGDRARPGDGGQGYHLRGIQRFERCRSRPAGRGRERRNAWWIHSDRVTPGMREHLEGGSRRCHPCCGGGAVPRAGRPPVALRIRCRAARRGSRRHHCRADACA